MAIDLLKNKKYNRKKGIKMSGTLKDNFKRWLISQGLHEKTRSKRPSSVYEYVRRIDRCCDLVYNAHDVLEWEYLSEDIVPILGCYLLCQKGGVHLNHTNLKEVRGFIDLFLSKMSPYQKNLEKVFVCEVHSGQLKKDITRGYSLLEHILDTVQNDVSSTLELFVDIQLSQKEKNKNRIALNKFYQFLQRQEKTQKTTIPTDVIQKKCRNRGDIFLNEITSFKAAEKAVFKITPNWGDNTTAPRLIPLKLSTGFEVKVSFREVLHFLHISYNTLKRLEDSTSNPDYCLKPIAGDKQYYSLDAVNAYALKHFHSPNKDVTFKKFGTKQIWLTAKETEEKLNWSHKKLQRNKEKMTYFNPAPSVFLYYAPEIINLKRKRKI